MEKKKLLSLYISTGSYKQFVKTIAEKAMCETGYACVANVHMLIEAHKRSSFAEIVNNAAIVTPDGKPLTWMLRSIYGLRQQRVAGMDLLPDLLAEAEASSLPVFFYGGSEATLKKAESYVSQEFPSLNIAGMYSPPFRPLSFKEENLVADKINNSGARLVFVVLGCPKQEQWMASMTSRVNAFMVGIGGALPVLIGMQKRAPRWMQSSGMEWLYRLLQEPQRLFKRYAITNSLFLFLFFKAYLRKKFLHQPA